MENMVMGIAFGTAVSVFRKGAVKGYKGTYNQIKLADIENAKPKSFPVAGNRFAQVSSDNFSKIPGMPVAYWVSVNTINAFDKPKLESGVNAVKGLDTCDNDTFVRFWNEVDIHNINFSARSSEDTFEAKWYPYCKGGGYSKWYGFMDKVVDWKDDGNILRNLRDSNGKIKSRPQNIRYYFKEGLTWSTITSYKLSLRYMNHCIFGGGGSAMFMSSNLYYNLCFVNSKVTEYFLSFMNPTLNFLVGDILGLPIIIDESKKEVVEPLARNNINISKIDWDSFEPSWDFKTHPLLKPVPLISEAFAQWSDECEKRFTRLKSNEEELNRIFIDIYGLQDELTPEVEEKDVTVRRADLTRDIKSLVSYAVGCMFGRYSLDSEGLAYAGGEWDGSKYKTFIPDPDNCIPVTDEEYFRDDIVVRFVDFIRTVYGADTLEENLTFIADALGTRGNTSRERIRNYFLNDFIKDHIKMYQKRPIYWMFDSGKQNGFRALVYMHRWNADTTGNVRVEYLHKLQRIYENEIRQSQDVAETGSGREVSAAQKRIEKLTKQLKETHDFDEKIAHLALSRIDIDLDDGVKVNYEKVQTGDDGKKIEVLTKI